MRSVHRLLLLAVLVAATVLVLVPSVGSAAPSAALTTTNLGSFDLKPGTTSKTFSQLWDLTQSDLQISYTLDMTGAVAHSDWSTAWTSVGLIDGSGMKGWMSSGSPGIYYSNPSSQDVADKHNLGAPGRLDEISYDATAPGTVTSPFGTNNSYGLWFDRNGVDQYQATNWGMVNGKTYNTAGKYNVVLSYHRINQTVGTMFATVNGIKTGFWTAGWKNAQPEIYDVGKSFGGDFGRMKVGATYWAPDNGYGTIKVQNLTVTASRAASAGMVDIVKTASTPTVSPGGTIDYTMKLVLGSPQTKVTVEDSFLDGVDLVPDSATFDGVPITPVKTAQHLNRIVYEFRLGDVPAGTYLLKCQGQVSPTKQAGKGQKVTNATNLYINGKWRDKSQVSTPVVPAP